MLHGFLEGICLHIFPSDNQQIAQAENEHAAVPQCAAIYQFLCLVFIGLFGKSFHLQSTPDPASGYDIAVFGGSISRLYAHKHQLRYILLHCFGHLLDDTEVALIGIWVTRHDNNHLVRTAQFLFFQIQAGQGDDGEGVPPFWLGHHTGCTSQLAGYDIRFPAPVAMVTSASKPDSAI